MLLRPLPRIESHPGSPMKIERAEFITSAADRGGWPPGEAPEIAFAGRSNVGKSSLINVLLNRKNLVKTSTTPGKTQLINFFRVNDRFSFVDLPGYGYAQVPLAVKRRWRPLIEEYLRDREALVGVVVLIDARRGMGEMDLDILEWIGAVNLPACLILTKSDKLKSGDRRAATAALTRLLLQSAGLYGRWSGPILFSSHTKAGRREILAQLEEWIEGPLRGLPAA